MKNQKIKFIFIFWLLLSPIFVAAQTVVEQGNNPSEFAQHGLETLNKTISAANAFLGVLFLASLIGFIVSGVKFVIAGGSEEMLESARRTGLASIVGFFLSLVGYVIINIIKHFIV